MRVASLMRNTLSSTQGIALKPQRRFSWGSLLVVPSAMTISLTHCHKKSFTNSPHSLITQRSVQKTVTSITPHLFSPYHLLKIELDFVKFRKNCLLHEQLWQPARRMRKPNSTHGFNHSRRIRSLQYGLKRRHLSILHFLRVREIKQRHLF